MKFFKQFLRIDRYLNALYLDYQVHRFVKEISPDLVNLHGTEDLISAPFLRIAGTKVLTIQGFIHFVYKGDPNPENKRRLRLEQEIFRTTRDVIIQAKFIPEIIREYNPDARFHTCQYPAILPGITAEEVSKDTDLIFVARICKDKGIEDLLAALIKIKSSRPDVTLKIIGRVSSLQYQMFLEDFIVSHGLQQNVNFLGFISSNEEMYGHMARSSVYVLPTHHDVIPSTVIESMFIGTPVISNAVGGLVDLNEQTQTCILVEPANVDRLARAIVEILNNPGQQEILVNNARAFVQTVFNPAHVAGGLMNIYRTLIS